MLFYVYCIVVALNDIFSVRIYNVDRTMVLYSLIFSLGAEMFLRMRPEI